MTSQETLEYRRCIFASRFVPAQVETRYARTKTEEVRIT